jgi:formylglycine-generating enzyme
LTNWSRLTNRASANGAIRLVDDTATNFSHRFYRAHGSPPPPGMALVPAGSFQMGNCMDPAEGSPIELPAHTVYASGFYMDQMEVTKALWDDVYNWATNHSYTFDDTGLGKATNHPVQFVNWYDAVKWCNARSEKEGRTPAYYSTVSQTAVYRNGQVDVQAEWVNWTNGYRLPTEAEWEKAARGGASGHRFPWVDADTITQNRANYKSESGIGYDTNLTQGYHSAFNDGIVPITSPVGYFAPNGYGLYDMAGNVFEWCWDFFDPNYYAASPGLNPCGPATSSDRVLRGGSWYHNAFLSRSAFRISDPPAFTAQDVGFRSVLPVERP